MTTPTRRTALLCAGLLGYVLTGCETESPVQADAHSGHDNSLTTSALSQAGNAQALDDLRRLSAPFHDLEQAEDAGYGLFAAPPLTTADGCISDQQAGGMGYHYTRGDNLVDDAVTLLDPEFLVYAPTKSRASNGAAITRLAGFDYFIPYSPTWPGPDDANFVRAPTLHDFPSMSGLPDIGFAPSRFNGWMFHIWLWDHNPDGMFANWNPAVPLCQGSEF
jgi:hypothetical protein